MIVGKQVSFINDKIVWVEKEIIFINTNYIVSIEDYNFNPFLTEENEIFKTYWGYKIKTVNNETHFISVENRSEMYTFFKNYNTPDRG